MLLAIRRQLSERDVQVLLFPLDLWIPKSKLVIQHQQYSSLESYKLQSPVSQLNFLYYKNELFELMIV